MSKWYEGATRGQWLALTAALLGWMFDGFEMGIFPLIAKPALRDLLTDTDERTVGLWFSITTACFLVGAAAGGWVFGWLGDRLGRVRAMVFSVLTYAIFTGLGGLAQDQWQLAGLRFLAALGMGGEWSLGVALVMESWPGHARPVLAGLIGAAANVGFVLTGLLVMGLGELGLQLPGGGWRWVLGICAFPALLTFFIRMFVPESEKWQHAVQTAPRAGFSEIFSPGLRWRTIIAATLSGIALIGTWGSVQWIPQWVNSMKDGNQQQANYAQIASGIGAIIGSFCGAVIGQGVRRRWAYLALCVASVAVCAFLYSRFADHRSTTPAFLATVTTVGLFTAAFYGWLPLYLPELFPTRVRATGQGFAFNFGRIVAAAGALTAGVLVSRVFEGSYPLAGATISLIYVIGMLAIWFAPETRGQSLPE